MTEVKVEIPDKDPLVGAMARGLAFQIEGGNEVVKGQTTSRLELFGFLTFRFNSALHAQEFRDAVGKYLGMHGAITQ